MVVLSAFSVTFLNLIKVNYISLKSVYWGMRGVEKSAQIDALLTDWFWAALSCSLLVGGGLGLLFIAESILQDRRSGLLPSSKKTNHQGRGSLENFDTVGS